RERNVFTDRVSNPAASVILQRQPNLEGTKAPRQLDAVIPKRKRLFVDVPMCLDVIGFFRAERCFRRRIVTEEKTAGIDGDVKPLVRIERNRIGEIQAGEEMLLAFVENAGRAVCAVDVKPEIKFSGDGGDLRKRIDYARVRCAGAADDAERSQAFASIGFNPFTQLIDTHALSFIAGNLAHVIASEAENVCCFRDRHVNFGRCVNSHWWPGVPEPTSRYGSA